MYLNCCDDDEDTIIIPRGSLPRTPSCHTVSHAYIEERVVHLFPHFIRLNATHYCMQRYAIFRHRVPGTYVRDCWLYELTCVVVVGFESGRLSYIVHEKKSKRSLHSSVLRPAQQVVLHHAPPGGLTLAITLLRDVCVTCEV